MFWQVDRINLIWGLSSELSTVSTSIFDFDFWQLTYLIKEDVFAVNFFFTFYNQL